MPGGHQRAIVERCPRRNTCPAETGSSYWSTPKACIRCGPTIPPIRRPAGRWCPGRPVGAPAWTMWTDTLAPGEALLITVGRLLRGPVGDVVTDGAVLVRDGGIVAEGARTDVIAAAGAAGPDVRRIDLPQSTMLPGLINGHVHLAMDGGPDPVRSLLDSDPRRLAREMACTPGSCSTAGSPPCAIWVTGPDCR